MTLMINQAEDTSRETAALRQRIAQLEIEHMEHQRMQEALASLLVLSQTLVTTYDVNLVLVQAVKSAVEIASSADRGSIQLLNDMETELRTVAISDIDEPIVSTIPFQPGVGVAGHALVSKQPIYVADVLTDDRFVRGSLPLKFRSLLVTPLVFKNKRLGTLSLSSEQINAFSPSQERLVKLIGDQMAVALENARLFTELNKQNEPA